MYNSLRFRLTVIQYNQHFSATPTP